jgi:3-ketoacyl-CoA synthase
VARHVVGGRETLLATVMVSFMMGAGLAGLRVSRRKRVCLVDFTVYKPPEDWKVNLEHLMALSCTSNTFTKKSLNFSLAVTKRSGVAPVGTYLPPAITNQQPKTMKASREEAEHVMFGCLDDLFGQTGIRPKDVGILIVNCSLFNPTPSLTAMIVNHYRMRPNIVTYNLSGMGCSAGLIAISLAQELLQVHKNTYAVVVSTENITKNFYMGNARSMMIPNMLFRVGGAAIALSNRPRDFGRAKYELTHLVRTHRGADDESYQTVFQKEDDTETVGVFLSKGLMNVAGETLKINMSTLGPQVLPYSEQLKFLWNIIQRKVLKRKMKAYIPDFRKAFEHFCIHAGGRGVIDALEENLKLTTEDVLPSRHALKYYGNTSSASIWYELAWSETFPTIQRGDRVWQIGFGSGFKCNSAVWRALRDVDDQHKAWVAVSNSLPRKRGKEKRL